MIEIGMPHRELQHDSFIKLLEKSFFVHKLWEEGDENYIKNNCFNVNGMVTDHIGANRNFIKQFPNLKIISNFGVGFDSVDVNYASQLGIQVTNTPGVLTDDVADLGMSLLISVSRGILEGDKFVRRGMWNQGIMRFTQSITGKKMGIIGMGRIGQAIANRAKSFKIEVI